MRRLGSAFKTAAGVYRHPVDPHPDDVDKDEIAHALSHVCRYGGHVPGEPYSVAEHSVYVMRAVVGAGYYDLALLALWHDAPEAFVGDVIRPLKKYPEIGEVFARLERAWMKAIAEHFDWPRIGSFEWDQPLPAPIKYADDAVLLAERRDIFGWSGDPSLAVKDVREWPGKVEVVGWRRAKEMFLAAHEEATEMAIGRRA